MTYEYQAYLLRLERNDSKLPWRILMRNVQSGEEYRIMGKQESMGFLFALLSQPSVSESVDSGMDS